ncbi:MAG: dihydropteroate synthase [Lachnospiraceae bacterium]|nr:dihydropteroate synthase [Lachnospiraceae bacterium]
MVIGTKKFDDNRTYVMGILNVTPDSFSDGGRFVTMDKVIEHANQMAQEGASIIDVGGESTRPGYTMISAEEEISRVVPAIEAIKERLDIPVSIDTYKSAVAEAAICAGADMVNDIWGLQYDSKMAKTIKQYDVSVAITHNKDRATYSDFEKDVIEEMKALCKKAEAAGISKDKIVIDPGIGFVKSTEQNLLVMKNLEEFVKIGYPVLLGASRKSFIGNTLGLPVDDRLEGTLATTAVAVKTGTRFVRVHDVKENVRLINMLESIRNA